MTHKNNEPGKGRRRSGRSRRRLHALYLAVIGVLAIAGVAVFAFGDRGTGASAQQVAAATGTLATTETFFDFGRISMKNGKVRHRYALRNDSGVPALVKQLYTSCMCTETSLLVGGESLGPYGMQGMGYTPRIDRVIPAGTELAVEAVFDPNAHGPAGVGRNDRAVSVVMGDKRVIELQFTAYVTP
ncbi:MAG: DUF1573 domain-containing protein [Candidatus Lambdaproteobacteria bacterium]|nr:DUF1573 domain-containing protein [Candidatus Lambdaproteobacteria bacterium]